MRKIFGSSFTEKEATQLTHLLTLVAKDGGRWPTQEAFLEADRAVCRPAAEIVITDPPWMELETMDFTREETPLPRILLVMYGTEGGKGGFGPHWTLPGGRLAANEGIAETVRRVGLRELETGVTYLGQILMDRKWKEGDHPDGGKPLSLYVKCEAEVTEIPGKRQFFPVNLLPDQDKKDGFHVRNLDEYFKNKFEPFES